MFRRKNKKKGKDLLLRLFCRRKSRGDARKEKLLVTGVQLKKGQKEEMIAVVAATASAAASATVSSLNLEGIRALVMGNHRQTDRQTDREAEKQPTQFDHQQQPRSKCACALKALNHGRRES